MYARPNRLSRALNTLPHESISDCLGKRNMDWSTLKSSMKASVAKYIYEQTKRSPMILPIIEEI